MVPGFHGSRRRAARGVGMGPIGVPELIIILVIVLIIWGYVRRNRM